MRDSWEEFLGRSDPKVHTHFREAYDFAKDKGYQVAKGGKKIEDTHAVRFVTFKLGKKKQTAFTNFVLKANCCSTLAAA